MKMAMVVARGKNGVIGVDGDLPWRIPEDLKFFKRVTLGKPIIMGRKTFDSLGRALPGRLNIVITRDATYECHDAVVVQNLEEAVQVAKEEAVKTAQDEIMIIGGAQIYTQFLEKADRLFITEVDLSPEGDAFFPDFEISQWKVTWEEAHEASADKPAYRFVQYDRLIG